MTTHSKDWKGVRFKTCSYRNCGQSYIGRNNSKFCCIKCKRNEKKYEQRATKKFKQEKDEVFSLLDQLKAPGIDQATFDLYNKIYR